MDTAPIEDNCHNSVGDINNGTGEVDIALADKCVAALRANVNARNGIWKALDNNHQQPPEDAFR